MTGVTFGKYHSFNKWGLILLSTKHGEADAKTTYIDIPGADGQLDESTALTDGDIKYNNRTHEYSFYTKKGPIYWNGLMSEIRNAIDGKQMQIIEDRDKNHYWMGRAAVKSISADGAGGKFSIEVNVEPYKYEIQKYNNWLWDSFNFENDVVREYQGLTAGTYAIAGTRQWKPLKLNIKSGKLTAISLYGGYLFYGKEYTGKVTFRDIVIKESNREYTFEGTADLIFDILYEGGSL